MPDITINSEVGSYRALVQSLPAAGIYDGSVTYKPESTLSNGVIVPASCTLSNSVASQTQFQDAIDAAQAGGLNSNKANKVDEAESKTKSLFSEGTMYTGEDSQQHGPVEVSAANRTSIKELINDVNDGLIVLPQLISTTDGRGVVITDPLDLQHVYKSIIDRGVYLLGDQANLDSSLGESMFIISVINAADQSALDLIVDTRS